MKTEIPYLERNWKDEDGIEYPKKSILTGKSDGASQMIFENIETKERPSIYEIDLDTGETILFQRVNINQTKGVISCDINFEKTKLDLSKYHIVFK